jgi:hypothetical protein
LERNRTGSRYSRVGPAVIRNRMANLKGNVKC